MVVQNKPEKPENKPEKVIVNTPEQCLTNLKLAATCC